MPASKATADLEFTEEESDDGLSPKRLFGRTLELDRMSRLLSHSTPSSFVLLTGPPDVGKTALMQQLAADRTNAGKATLYIRAQTCLTSVTFKAQLVTQLWKTLRYNTWPDTDLKHILEKMQRGSQYTLRDVLDLMVDSLEAHKDNHNCPTIVVDEAQWLRCWQETDWIQLNALIHFFMLVTKEANLAHVVLISHKPLLEYWLGDRLGHHQVTIRVLGDFTEQIARDFFLERCIVDLPEQLKESVDWDKVWEVCKGRPHLLLSCAERAAESLNWNDAIQSIVGDAMRQIRAYLHPANFEGAEEEKKRKREILQTFMKKISEAPNHAVPEDEMQAVAGDLGEMLTSFLKNNVLHVRHASDLRGSHTVLLEDHLDIPSDEHGRSMIMAWTPAQCYAMGMLANQNRVKTQ